VVVSAGLSPAADTENARNDREFLRQMYREGLANYDNVAVGVHPYGWGNPPDLVCCDPRADFGFDEQPQFFFLNTLVDYRNIMLRFDDDDADMWVTEFGWSSWEDLGAAPPEPWMAYLTPDAQAQAIARAFEIGQSLDAMGPMFLWNFNFANEPLIANRDGIVGFSLTRTDAGGNLNIRPVFQILLGLLG
jgi:hypothetical protein